MGTKVKKGIVYLALILLSVLCLGPFLVMLVNATRNSQDIMSGFTLIPGSSLSANWALMYADISIYLEDLEIVCL